jgi:hypothetical protein
MTLGKRVVIVIDYVAMTIAFLFLMALVANALMQGLYAALRVTWQVLNHMFTDHDDRIALVAVAVAAVWCRIRWKALNEPRR